MFTPFFYTLEFLFILGATIVIIILHVKDIEKRSLKIFVISSVIISGVELLLQGLGTRSIENAYFFTIPIGFPWICFIMGFFDGGLKNLFAYHTVKIFTEKNKFSSVFAFILFTTLFIAFYIYNGLIYSMGSQQSLNVTTSLRKLFSPSSILFLILAFAITFLYFFLNKNVPKKNRKILLYYAFGLIIFLISWMTTSHIFMTRYIGVDGTIPATLTEQILLMWIFFLFFEGVGVSIFIAPVLYHLKLFEVSNDN